MDAETLLNSPLPKPEYLIDGLLPRGLSLLGGASKSGKSWLVLLFALHIAEGTPVWDIPTHRCEVLYISLEDTFSRLQERVYRLTDEPDPGLTNLITELLDLVDEGRIGLRPAVELSYLPRELQRNVADAISVTDATPSHDQAIRMRRQYDQGTLNRDAIVAIMTEAKPNQRNQLRFSKEDFGSYFPAGYTPAQMKRDILKGLELLQRERRRERDGR